MKPEQTLNTATTLSIPTIDDLLTAADAARARGLTVRGGLTVALDHKRCCPIGALALWLDPEARTPGDAWEAVRTHYHGISADWEDGFVSRVDGWDQDTHPRQDTCPDFWAGYETARACGYGQD